MFLHVYINIYVFPSFPSLAEGPTRTGDILDSVLPTKEGLVGNGKLKVSLGCSDHELVEFEILSMERRAHCNLPILDFRKSFFGVSRDLLGRVLCDKTIKGIGARESCENLWSLTRLSMKSSPWVREISSTYKG